MRKLLTWLTLIVLHLAALTPFASNAAEVRCNASANCNVSEAQAECQSFDLSGDQSIVKVTGRECLRRGASDAETGYFILRYKGLMSNGYETGWTVGDSFYYRNNCSSEPSYTGQGPWSSFSGGARSGSYGCRNGCDGRWFQNADNTYTWQGMPGGEMCPDDQKKACEILPGHYWNAVLRVCEPPSGDCPNGAKPNSLGQCAPEPCPDGMAQQPDGTCKKKDNECPAGQVRSPDGKCLPGDGQCAAGEVRGPDGTCKKDRDGDGQPDPVDEESFAGGDDCSSPPACSGSPIMCGQARIQWRIDCNTRKNRNIAGGTCASMPVCTGEKCDAMEYAGLLMQWRSACALEKMAQGDGNGGGENGDVKAIRDALTGTGGSVSTPPDRPASDVWSPSSGQPTRPDASGYGWGRGCPQPPAIEVMGQTIAFDITPLCRWLGLGSYFVVGLAALFCLRIIASRDA
ncbi:virulence factor TspB C-terminal domain-related protein [Stenotrophomonas pavanii]|nr:virulence factor TspB C-terminal domain-related protein [Stenotrophomonas pavanii]